MCVCLYQFKCWAGLANKKDQVWCWIKTGSLLCLHTCATECARNGASYITVYPTVTLGFQEEEKYSNRFLRWKIYLQEKKATTTPSLYGRTFDSIGLAYKQRLPLFFCIRGVFRITSKPKLPCGMGLRTIKLTARRQKVALQTNKQTNKNLRKFH